MPCLPAKVIARKSSLTLVPHFVPLNSTIVYEDENFKLKKNPKKLKLHNSTKIWPQGNAAVEIVNKSLNKAIVAANTEGKNWRKAFWDFILTHNVTPHTTTKLAPATVRFGRAIRSVLPDVSSTTPISKEILNRDLQAAQRDNLRKFHTKSYADKHRGVKERLITVGDIVIIRQQKHSKLTPKFNRNPLTVKGKWVTNCFEGGG